MKPLIYLAGPITDCDAAEALDWRAYVNDRLRPAGIIGISPLRCEPLHGERYALSSADPRFGTARAISSKNKGDTRRCDMTLAYLPRAINERRLSIGTLMELAWASAFNRDTILVSDYPFVIEHPVVQANAGWVLSTLDEAIDVIIGVFADYAK